MKKIIAISLLVLFSAMLTAQAQPAATSTTLVEATEETIASSYNEEIDSLYDVLNYYETLLTEDTTVFEELIDLDEVPLCLKGHYRSIEKIVLLKQNLETVEGTIAKLTSSADDEKNNTEYIHDIILDKMLELNDLITEIKKLDLSTLSKAQLEYFKPGLTNRFNQILTTYFE